MCKQSSGVAGKLELRWAGTLPGKVFAHVLLERLQPLLTRQRRPQQSGFTRTRSTIDAILALRLLAELHREFRKPLHVAYQGSLRFSGPPCSLEGTARHWSSTISDPADPGLAHGHNVKSSSRKKSVEGILHFLGCAAGMCPSIILSGN